MSNHEKYNLIRAMDIMDNTHLNFHEPLKAPSDILPNEQSNTQALWIAHQNFHEVESKGEPPAIQKLLSIEHYWGEPIILNIEQGTPLPVERMPKREYPSDWWTNQEQQKKASDFFDMVAGGRSYKEIMLIIFTQAVQGRSATFLKNLKKYFSFGIVADKGKNTDLVETTIWDEEKYPREKINREFASNPNFMIPMIDTAFLRTPTKWFEVLDMGGYISESGEEIQKNYRDRFIISIEDTKNGLLRKSSYRFGTMADNLLKNFYEDYAVGKRIAYNTFMLFYDIPQKVDILINGEIKTYYRGEMENIMQYGLGDIGTGTADGIIETFLDSGLAIHDIDTDKRDLGREKGLPMINPEEELAFLENADIIFSCTGNGGPTSIKKFKPGTKLALSTSADVELGKEYTTLGENYYAVHIDRNIILYISKDDPARYIWAVNGPKAANFAMASDGKGGYHGGKYSADIGPLILPGQAMILELALQAAEYRDNPELLNTRDLHATEKRTEEIEEMFLSLWPNCRRQHN